MGVTPERERWSHKRDYRERDFTARVAWNSQALSLLFALFLFPVPISPLRRHVGFGSHSLAGTFGNYSMGRG